MKRLGGVMLVTAGFILACGLGGKDGEEQEQEEEEKSFDEKVAESEPLDPSPVPQEVAGRQITAELCAFESKTFLGESTMSLFKSIVALDDKLVLADEKGELHGFEVTRGEEGCKLSADKSFGGDGVLTFEREINYLSKDDTGRIMASNGVHAAYSVINGIQKFECTTGGYVELSPTGRWGVAPWVNADVKLVSFADDSCTTEPWVLKNLGDDATREGIFDSVNTAGFLANTVLVGGSVAEAVDEDGPRQVALYTRDGREQARFGGSQETGSEQNFGWLHALSPCRAGICALDSNYRRLTQWSDKGDFVGALDLSALFDLKYPWIADFDIAPDGAAFFLTGQKREDSDVAEGLVFRVEGIGEAATKAGDAPGSRAGQRPRGPRAKGMPKQRPGRGAGKRRK